MAYNPYAYGGFQPAPYYPGSAPDQLSQLRQSQAQQPMLPGAPPPTQSNPIWVQGEEGAKAYMVAPGSSVMLMDSENTVFYLKSSDQSGMPLPLRVFDYTERTASSQPKHPPTPQFDPSQYITRDELENILAERLKKPVKTTKPKEDIDHE